MVQVDPVNLRTSSVRSGHWPMDRDTVSPTQRRRFNWLRSCPSWLRTNLNGSADFSRRKTTGNPLPSPTVGSSPAVHNVADEPTLKKRYLGFFRLK